MPRQTPSRAPANVWWLIDARFGVCATCRESVAGHVAAYSSALRETRCQICADGLDLRVSTKLRERITASHPLMDKPLPAQPRRPRPPRGKRAKGSPPPLHAPPASTPATWSRKARLAAERRAKAAAAPAKSKPPETPTLGQLHDLKVLAGRAGEPVPTCWTRGDAASQIARLKAATSRSCNRPQTG